MLIDSHAHLTSQEFDNDLDEVLLRAKEVGVSKIFNICTTLEEVKKGLLVQKKYPWIFNVAATTPHEATEVDDFVFLGFREYALQKVLSAIGETGLDYYYEHSPKKKQIELFQKYIQLADEAKLPLVIHCRDAFADLFAILQDFKGKVLLHCFTGTMNEAEEAIQRGYFISFSGIVTFNKSGQLQSIAKALPLSHMMIETDAPYLAPQSKRGFRNEPSFIYETAQFLTQLKDLSFDAFSLQISHNVNTFFGHL